MLLICIAGNCNITVHTNMHLFGIHRPINYFLCAMKVTNRDEKTCSHSTRNFFINNEGGAAEVGCFQSISYKTRI